MNQRVYDGDVYVNNETKKVSFKSNPGDTTEKWKADLYIKAPIVAENTEIPLLAGWEKKLLNPGCRAWFEELDSGKPGVQAALFDARKVAYRDALERESTVNTTTSDEGYKINATFVQPQ